MSLTVPQGGVIAGRSADTAVNRPFEGGAALEGFGQAMMQVGRSIKADQDQLQTQRTQLAVTREMGQARLEVEQIGDPGQIGPAWEARKAEIRARHLKLDDKGNPTIDPAQAEAFDLMLTDLDNKHALALGEKAINLTRSQREAAWVDMSGEIAKDALTADQDTFTSLVDLGLTAIDNRAAAGLISPEQAATEKQTFREGLYKNRANARIETDPAGFLTDAESGIYDGLGADALANGRLAAEKELARREAEASKEAERQTTQRNTAIKARLGDMASIAKDGRKASDEAFLALPDVQAAAAADPEVAAALAEVEAARALRDELPGLRQMTPAQMKAEIAKEEAKPLDMPYQTERLKVLRQWQSDLETKWNTNKVDAARAAGMAVPQLPAFDATDPAPFAEGVAARLSYDTALKSQGYGNAPGLFGTEEKAQIDAVIDPKADMAPKLALAEALAGATRGKPETVLRGMAADPAFNHATMMLAVTGDRELSRQILSGAQKDALGTVNLPAEKQMTAIFDQITGGIYEDNPKAKAQVLAAARAYYANSAAGTNPDGADSVISFMDDTAAQDAYRIAVQRVTGATPDANGELTVGGVQDVRGMMTTLPPGVSVRAVERAFDVLDDDLSGPGFFGGNMMASSQQSALRPNDPMLRFKAASLDGSAPDLGSDPQAWLRQTYLVQVQGDVYELHYSKDGRSYPVRSADGNAKGSAWRFKLSGVISGAER